MKKKANIGLQAGIFAVVIAVFALSMFSILVGKFDTQAQDSLSESSYNLTTQGTTDTQEAISEGLGLMPIIIIGVMAIVIIGSIMLLQKLL